MLNGIGLGTSQQLGGMGKRGGPGRQEETAHTVEDGFRSSGEADWTPKKPEVGATTSTQSPGRIGRFLRGATLAGVIVGLTAGVTGCASLGSAHGGQMQQRPPTAQEQSHSAGKAIRQTAVEIKDAGKKAGLEVWDNAKAFWNGLSGQ